MKPEQWITSLGLIFIIGLIIGALLPDNFWDRQHQGGRNGVGHRLAHVVQDAGPVDAPQAPYPQQPTVAGAAWPQTGTAPDAMGGGMQQFSGLATAPAPQVQARNIAAVGLIPFEAGTTRRYEGQVQQITVRGADLDWSQVHILVADPAGAAREISLAPDWYLLYMGCMVSQNTRVAGLAFQFDRVTSNPVLYAKDIVISGRKCQLRNDEGLALWSNQLR
ncbi:MAG: hypothetical protein FD165_1773 [Gammaproteobacteria bacterium]|nr:MAG: hypothetical protein FD165_1773 [Gammaproteobacteria bacterium]TND04346.1 MAG: hypothetical protein FD120_1460 [Gammaproteobacteria bacterium]